MISYNIRAKLITKDIIKNTGTTHIRRATQRIRRHWLRKNHMMRINREKTRSKQLRRKQVKLRKRN